MSLTVEQAFVVLLRELFEGKPEGQPFTWVVEGHEGIFDALDTVSAERASIKPSAESSSIAGHAYHVLFLMRFGNSAIGGPAVEGNWETSWEKQQATDEEWAQLRSDVRFNFEFFLSWLSEHPDWTSGPMLQGMLSALPHLGYHLGAIRQPMKVA